MSEIQFKISEYGTEKVLIVEFGTILRCNILLNGKSISDKPIVSTTNTVFQITDQKKKIIEQETKGEVSIPPGIYTRLEIESSQILFHATELPTDFTNQMHVEKAYQNMMDKLIEKVPEYTSGADSNNRIESFIVLLSIPFLQDKEKYSKSIQMHLQVLKNLGFTKITFLNQIAASFYSQKDKLIQKNIIDNPIGLLINIGKTTQIGVMDKVILPEGFLELNLGTTSALTHSHAILRDLNVTGVGNDTIVQWLIEHGRIDGSAPVTVKNIRRKEINISPILNSPRILFDFKAVTNMENNPNSIIIGILQSINSTKTNIQEKLSFLLKNIVVTGPGAFFKGIDKKIVQELQIHYPNQEINVLIGEEPLNSVSNGLVKYISLYPKLKVFNLVESEKETPVEGNLQSQLNQIVKEIQGLKNYLQNLDELLLEANKLSLLIEKAPIQLKTIINVKIAQEIKSWIVEFNLFLNPLIKKAQNTLEEADEMAIEFRKIGIKISSLPNFIKPSLAKVFTSYVYGLEMVKNVHLDSVNKEYLRILLENNRFQDLDEYSLADLAKASDLNASVIIDVLAEYLANYPNYGYLFGKFIKFSEQNLNKIDIELNNKLEAYFLRVEQKGYDKAEETKLITESSEIYDFLIKGHTYLKNDAKATKYRKEKESFS